jgi:hypothetical protein
MNESPPPDLPPEPSPPPSSAPHETPPSGLRRFVLGFFGAIGGFALFLLGAAFTLSIGKSGGFVVSYLLIAFAGGLSLAMKQSTRGLAVGIFLGLGATLLIIAICSGFHIN